MWLCHVTIQGEATKASREVRAANIARDAARHHDTTGTEAADYLISCLMFLNWYFYIIQINIWSWNKSYILLPVQSSQTNYLMIEYLFG